MQAGRRVGAVIAMGSVLFMSIPAMAQQTAPPTAEPAPPSGASAPDESAAPPPTDPGPPPVERVAPPGDGAFGAQRGEAVPVSLAGADGETVNVAISPDWVKPGTAPPLATCRLPCGFQMERGRYRIEVAETDGTLRGNRPVTIAGPSRLFVTPRDRSTRTTGLVLGVGGAVAILAGSIMFVADLANSDRARCDGNFCRSEVSLSTVGVSGGLLVLAGAIATPIGWVMFGKSFRPAIDVEEGVLSGAPRGVVGVVGVPGGAGFGGKFVF